MANYIVTGAAGFIGSTLAKRLLDEGNSVVTIDNLSTGFTANVPAGVVFIQGDCADPAIYDCLPEVKYDGIFHIAGQSSGEISFEDPIYDIRTNAESTLLLLKFALKNQCKKFVYASTVSVYGVKPDRPICEQEHCVPESFYGVAKIASEHYLRIYQQYGVNCTSLRLFNVYGYGQNMENLKQGMISIYLAQMVDTGHILVKGSGDRFRDFIYIDDVVESFVMCMSSSTCWNRSINVATGVKTTVDEVITIMRDIYGGNITVEYAGGTSGDVHGNYADVSLMSEMLGTWNKIDLRDGISKMIESISG